MTYLAQLRIQFCLRYKDFPIRCFSGCVSQVYYHLGGLDRNGTNLEHVWADFAVRIFFYNIRLSRLCQYLAWSNQIPDTKNLRWVWNLLFLDIFVVLFVHLRYFKQSPLFSALLIDNKLCAQHWYFLVLGSYLSTYLYVNPLNVSATILLTPDICWILGPNSSRISHQIITFWDSLRVAAWTIFLWSENTFIS